MPAGTVCNHVINPLFSPRIQITHYPWAPDANATNQSEYQFPNTRWSVILDAQGGDSEIRDRALEQICRIYWLPVYAFARGQGLQPVDAEDLTQNVLACLVEKGGFDRVAEEKGKLRSFLRVVTKNYLRNDWQKGRPSEARWQGCHTLARSPRC